MRKYIYFFLILCFVNLNCTKSGERKIYFSFDEALKQPDDVYQLRLLKLKGELPSELDIFQNLDTLYISGDCPQYIFKYNHLPAKFPVEICKLNNLKLLSIICTNIDSIPSEIKNLKELEVLRITLNKSLKKIPPEMYGLKNLKELHLWGNQLGSLSSRIENLNKLEELILNTNIKLTTLPSTIGRLKNLKFLDISSCNIEKLPDEIGKLINLEYLVIFDNKLKSLPIGIKNLKKLESILLRGNLFSQIEKEKIKKLLPHVEIKF